MRQICSSVLVAIALVLFASSALGQPSDPAVELGAALRLPPGALEATGEEASAQSAAGASAAAAPLDVDTTSRAAVAAFFASAYMASEDVAAGWTGKHASCEAGTTSQAYEDATLLRLNYYRAMAGLPGSVVLDRALSNKAQSAALIMSAQGALSHDPPTSWACYSAAGADGAGHSNIALGIAGPAAITAYMVDSGSNNSAIGHRRWILYPPQTIVGTGSIPAAAGKPASNALWVLGPFGARPATPEGTPWPNRGFVPYQIVPGRWSFSYPGANFSGATVSMWRGETAISRSIEPQAVGFGDNTLVWVPQISLSKPASDVTYRVQISNVVVGGAPRHFTYDVTVFDPASSPPEADGTRGDFNGDGKADVLWRHTGGSLVLWLMNGAAFASVASLGGVDSAWQIAGLGDFNGDGKADILWLSSGGGVAVWPMDGGGPTTVVEAGTVALSWQVAGVGDFDGDGSADILWRHSGGSAVVWLMSGGTAASVVGAGSVALSWQVAGVGDFNGDGSADILWRHSGGTAVVWLMSGGTAASVVGAGSVEPSWQVAGVGDFNGDGKSDVLWRHSGGSAALWLMNGGIPASVLGLGMVDPSWRVAGVGDFNGDGKVDIVWRHSGGSVVLWLMNGVALKSVPGLGIVDPTWVIEPAN